MQPGVIGRMPFFVLWWFRGFGCVGRRRRQSAYSNLQIPPLVLYLLYNEQEG
jgi:hypothetical protein